MSYKNVPQPSGLGEKERQILEDKEKYIVDLMDPLRVTRLLVDAGVIDATDRKKIISLVTVRDQNRALLGMLPKRGADALVQFVNVLIESRTENHMRLARILRNDDPSPHQGREIVEENQYTQLKDGFENHETRIQSLEEGDGMYGQKEVEALKAEIELKNEEIAKLREKLDKSEEKNEALRQKIKDLEEEVRTLKTALEEVRALAGKNEKEMQTLKEDAEKDRVDRELLKENAEKERGERERLSKEVQNLTSMVKNLQTAAASKDKTKPPASTNRRQGTAIRPRHRFEEPERPYRPELLKKGGGTKKQ